MQLLNSKILFNDKNTRYSNKKAQDTQYLVLFVCCSFFVLQRWWRCGDLPYSDCYRRSIACSRRGSRCKATARLLPCEIPADNKKQAVSTACFFGGDAGFVANIVCVITERKCLHFKAECQPGYRGSHGDAVLRFFKIAINPRIDDIEKQVEQKVQLVSRLSLTYEKATPKILPLCYVFIKSARKTRSITRAYSHIISVQNIPQNK